MRFKLITSAFMLLLTVSLSAQVMVGSDEAPANYSILQIEGVGGLQLPRLTLAERNAMTPLTTADAGMVIFLDDPDTNARQFQFWTGSTWLSMTSSSGLDGSTSGIYGNGGSVPYKLGGNLDEFTQIIQGENSLYFDATNSTFSVGGNAFVVTDGGVGINKTPSSIPDPATFDIKVDKGETGIRFKTVDPQQVVEPGSVLVSDELGNARWKSINIRPLLREGQFLDESNNPVPEGNPGNVVNGVNITTVGGTAWTGFNVESPKQISDNLTLSRGIWLVIARYVMVSNYGAVATGSNGYGHNTWIRLRMDGSDTDIVAVGQRPQLVTRPTGVTDPNWTANKIVATPQFVYLLTVESEASYSIYGDLLWPYASDSTSDNLGTVKLIDSTYGNSYFRAIRLSDDDF